MMTSIMHRSVSYQKTAAGGKAFFSRNFFASSTDFTRLLQDSEIHCLPQQPPSASSEDLHSMYVLAAGGMDLAMVQKVPQLHLARLHLKGTTIFGAKVVNKTLGNMSDVCARLLDAARNDGGIEAHATLHGLSEWALNEKLKNRSTSSSDTDKVLMEIANGKMDHYDEQGWEKLAIEYTKQGLGDEANLYMKRDAKLIRIDHQSDKTEFANTSGGAMAVFSFAS